MLELLNSIGRAEPGIRLLVCDPVTARDAESGASAGSTIRLQTGTRLEIVCAYGRFLSAYAEINEGLHLVHILARDYHRLELSR
jgi:hypothetical protein